MYLLRRTNRLYDTVTLMPTFAKAKEVAIEFVGEHYPVDGCSAERKVFQDNVELGIYHTGRPTSFGLRSAKVFPIEMDVTVDL